MLCIQIALPKIVNIYLQIDFQSTRSKTLFVSAKISISSFFKYIDIANNVIIYCKIVKVQTNIFFPHIIYQNKLYI